MRIIFVCTANICRSVMAEGILKKIVSTHPDAPDIEVQSFGIDAFVGMTPDRGTFEICLSHGIDIGLHSAQQLSKEALIHSDLVLCMEQEQKQLILSAFPKFVQKTFLLKEFLVDDLRSDLSIKDPTGKSKKYYKACFNEIEQEIKRIVVLILLKDIK